MSWHWFIGLMLLCSGSAWAGLEDTNIPVGNALRPKKIALLIGINQSSKTAHWPKLRYAALDARKMAQALRRRASFDSIVLLDNAQSTTKAALQRAIARLKRKVTNREDMVLVYISAHGTVSQGRRRFIVASDTTRNVSKTGVSVVWLRRQLKQLSSSQIGLILATCYSGMARSKSVRLAGAKGNLRPPNPMRQSRAIQILSAASFAQSAFESRRLQGDIYTHFFLDCFRKLKRKSIINIHVCAATKTTPYVKRWNGEVQVPKAYSELGANFDILLINPKQASSAFGYFRGTAQGQRYRLQRLGGKGRQSRQGREALGREFVAVPPGRYIVSVLDKGGKVVRREELTIQVKRVTPLPSDWSFEMQVGGWFTSGIFQRGGDFAGSGYLGLRHPFFGVFFGLTGTTILFEEKPYTQLSLELRFEGGYRHRWGPLSLFVGGYGTVGMLLQDINTTAQSTIMAHGGATLQFGGWLNNSVGLFLNLDAGLLPRLVNSTWFLDVVGGARVAVQFR